MSRVYISATYSDLKDCREAVYRALRAMGHDVIAMEEYVATDQRPLDKCLADVAACDLYVGIFAWRYGYVPTKDNPEQKSITELEFRHAAAKGIPRLIFLLDENAPWPRAQMEQGTGAEKLKFLRDEISTDYTISFFDSCQQLAVKASAAVANWGAHSTPSTGDSSKPVPRTPDKISTSRLPVTGRELFGRDKELSLLDEAWDDQGTHILSLVAWGGVGKSALVNHWLGRMARDDYRGARCVYTWSFYSQGTTERVVSADQFIESALVFFGDPDPNKGSPWDKGERLARLVGAQRALLILDGLEPLQHPPGADEGRLKDQALQSLLRSLAASNNGLCLISTRVPVTDLNSFENSTATRIDLEHLSPEAGAQVLRAQGVKGAQAELERASIEFGGHSLALTLLGSYLSDVYGGDVSRRTEIHGLEEDERYGRHAQKVIASYERWFGGGPELAVLRILGLFDRPADKDSINALRAAPVIPGLTEALQGLRESDWQQVLSTLRRAKLLAAINPNRGDTLDTHPLVRNYFGQQLKRDNPVAWREGNNRLYEHLKHTTKEYPETLEEMRPLYAAVLYGCEANRYQEALQDIYWRRISRGNEAFSKLKLGAFSTDLSALTSFFVVPWRETVEGITEADKSYLLSEVAFSLRALGRLAESVQPANAILETFIELKDFTNAAHSLINVSDNYLLIGDLANAQRIAREGVKFADRSGNSSVQIACRATLAHTLHQCGRLIEAENTFIEAENLLKEQGSRSPFLASLDSYFYCNLLIDQGKYQEVLARVAQTLERNSSENLLSIALSHLSLGQAYFLRDQHEGTGDFVQASAYLARAVDGLRLSGRLDYLPLGLLARAELRRVMGNFNAARLDIDESRSVATRGGLGIYHADCQLADARLNLALGEKDGARRCLSDAREMIERMGYHRRDKEVSELTSVAAFVEELQAGNSDVRLAAVQSLGNLGAHASLLNLVSRYAHEDDRQVRAALAVALQKVLKKDWSGAIQKLLIENGKASPSSLPMGSTADRLAALITYVHTHSELDLIYSADKQELSFRDSHKIQKIRDQWRTASALLDADPAEFIRISEAILKLICKSMGLSFSALTGNEEAFGKFYTFKIDAAAVFQDVRVNSCIPVLFYRGNELSESDGVELRDHLRKYLSEMGTVGFLALFSDTEHLADAKKFVEKIRKVYAHDLFALDLDQAMSFIGAKQPRRSLRRSVLARVNLANGNPFTTMGPAHDRTFVGREKELREITDHVQGSSYVLLGGRRIGKTSILRRLFRDRLPGAGFYTLFHDCSTTPTYQELIAAPAVEWQPARPPKAPHTIGEAFRSLPLDKPVVLLFDEADKLVVTDQKNGWQVFNTFRALVNAGRAQFVLSGERTLRAALYDSSAPLFNFANEMVIGRLDLRSVEELVTLPMKQLEIEFDDEAEIVKRVWEFTSGHPNVVQRLCSRLLERLHEQNTRRVTLDDVNAVISDAAFVRNDFLATYFSRATVLEHLCTLLMANDGNLRTLTSIHEALKDQGVNASLGQVDAALERLVYLRDVLTRTVEGYMFTVSAIPKLLSNTYQLSDLIALRREIFLHEGDVEPEIASPELRGRLW